MENIIGQKEFLKKIDNLKNLPNSFCLVGNEGSGKHLLAKYINHKFFNIDYLDITDSVNEETIDNIYTYPQKRMYVIDITEITEKEQNKLLKFLEEPYLNIYICLLAEDQSNLIRTVINRVQIFELDYYYINELEEVAEKNNITIDNKYYGRCLFTPGDVLKVKSNNIDLDKVDELADKIVNKLSVASFPNTLSIANKINFKDEYDKLDLMFLLYTLHYKYTWKSIEENDLKWTRLSIIVSTAYTDLIRDLRLDKKKRFTTMLIDLWETEHKCN